MIVGHIIRMNKGDTKGFPSMDIYLNNLLYSLLMTRLGLGENDEIRFYVDDTAEEFIKYTMDVPDSRIFKEEIRGMDDGVTDTVVAIMLAGGHSMYLPERFVFLSDAIYLENVKGIDRSKSMYFIQSIPWKSAFADERIKAAHESLSKWRSMESMKNDVPYFHCSLLGGISSPVWIEMANTIMVKENNAATMNEYEASLFVSHYLSKMVDLCECTLDRQCIRVPPLKRGKDPDTYVGDIRLELRARFKTESKRLEEYMTEKRIFR